MCTVERKRIDGRGYRDLRRTQFENGASGMCTVERDGTKLNSTVSVTTSRSPRTLECRHNLAITAAPFQMRSSRHHIRALEHNLAITAAPFQMRSSRHHIR